MRNFLVTVIVFFFTFGLNAQNATIDVIHLKDGSIFKGAIRSYEQGEALELTLKSGETITLKDTDIDRIVQEKVRAPSKNPLAPQSIYHSIQLSSNVGSNFLDESDWGLGFEALSGYWIDETFGVGVGTGIIQYSSDYAWRVVPVFLDFKIKGNNRSPFFLSGDVGLGFPIKNEDRNVLGGEAGERFKLGLGKIWTTRSNARLSFELAYLHQRVTFEGDAFFNGGWGWWAPTGDSIARDIRFKRYQLRIGFIF